MIPTEDDPSRFPLAPLTDAEALARVFPTAMNMTAAYTAAMNVDPFTPTGDLATDEPAMDAWQQRHPEVLAATVAAQALHASLDVRLGLDVG